MGKKQIHIFVYQLTLDDRSRYIGMTTNPEKRFKEHAAGYGSIHTRNKKILKKEILYQGPVANRWHARILENKIADTLRADHPGECIRGGELSDRFRIIVYKRAFSHG